MASTIKVSAKLNIFLAGVQNSMVRAFKVVVKNEELVLGDSHTRKNTWESDYCKFVEPSLDDTQCCYIFFKLDSRNKHGPEWLFLHWTPAAVSAREKMLYALASGAMKAAIGEDHIKEAIMGYVKDDLTLEGYRAHQKDRAAPPPLSQQEKDLEEVKRLEMQEASQRGASQLLRGLDLTLTKEVVAALCELKSGALDYVQLCIDRESIALSDSGHQVTVPDLASRLPNNEPRFHLYRLRARRDAPVVFLYTVPGSNTTSIRHRMLYSSSKSSLIDRLEKVHAINISRKFEFDSTETLTEEFLLDVGSSNSPYNNPTPVNKPHNPPQPVAPAFRGTWN